MGRPSRFATTKGSFDMLERGFGEAAVGGQLAAEHVEKGWRVLAAGMFEDIIARCLLRLDAPSL